MKAFVRILNSLVAIACVFIVFLFLWFFYLTLFRGMGGGPAIAYVIGETGRWWDRFAAWFGSLFSASAL